MKSLATKYKLNRSEEHTSELQSQSNLVCRLLLEKNTCVDPSLDLGARLDLFGPRTAGGRPRVPGRRSRGLCWVNAGRFSPLVKVSFFFLMHAGPAGISSFPPPPSFPT